MASFAFELVSPERLLVSEKADAVTAPGIEGEFTVLAQHAPFITVLKPGFVRITAGGADKSFYVRGGFAEVNPDGLTILADFAVPAAELDGIFAREVEIAETSLSLALSDETRRRAQERLDWLKDLRTSAAAGAH